MSNILTIMGDVLDEIDNSLENATGSSDTASVGDVLGPIITTVIFVVGIVAVVMIIVGGFRFVNSQGDAGQAKEARDTIMYGIIGLIIAIAAFPIVHFVLGVL